MSTAEPGNTRLPAEILKYELAIMRADCQQRHAGGKDTRTAKEVSDELKALLAASAEVDYIDVYGTSHRVRALGVTDAPYRQMEEAPN